MKKNIITACILALLSVISCAGNAKKDTSEHSEITYYSIVGVYLPVEYINILEKTKHNPTAWAINDFTDDDPLMHDILIVDFETVTAQDRIYDGGYKIYVWEIAQYQFEYVDNEIILTDHKNNRYKKITKITDDKYDVKDWDEHVGNFIGKIILDKLIQSGDIILEKDVVTIPALDNNKYGIRVWGNPDEKNLRFTGITDRFDDLELEIKDDEYIFCNDNYPSDIVWSKKF